MFELELSKFSLLKRLVTSDKLRILLMLSTPRTRSTALQIACAQAVEIDVQISAPFSNQQYGPISFYHDNKSLVSGVDLRPFEVGCNKIYEQYLATSNKHNGSVTGILAYEALSRLLDTEISQLLQLTREVIIPIRDPYRQFVSFLVQYFHDYFTGASSDRYLKASQVLNLISTLKNKTAEQCDLLWDEYITKEGVAKTLNKPPENVKGEDIITVLNQMIPFVNSELDIIWTNLDHCLDILSKPEYYQKNNVVIVDGEDFVDHSSEMLNNICHKLKLSYSNKMTDDWQKSSGNNFKSGHPTKDRLMGWSAPAKESSSIHKNNDSVDITPKAEDFPVELHGTLNKAWNIYRKCLIRPEFIHVLQPQISSVPNIEESKKSETEKLPDSTDKLIPPSSAQLVIAARMEYAPNGNDIKRKGNDPTTKDNVQESSMELRSGKRMRYPGKPQ